MVRDPDVHIQVLSDIHEFCNSIGWKLTALDYSPITGPEGNIEFLAKIIHGSLNSDSGEVDEKTISNVVSSAHLSFVRHI